MKNKIRIILSGKNPLLALSLKAILSDNDRFEVAAETSDEKELLCLLKSIPPTILVLNQSSHDDTGRTILRILKARSDAAPSFKVVLFGGHEINPHLMELTKLGAKGIIYNDCLTSEITDTLLKVAEKGFYFNEESLAYIFTTIYKERLDEINFTERQQEILKALQTGKSKKEISDLLNVTKDTVKDHIKKIFFKTNSHSLGELLNYLNCRERERERVREREREREKVGCSASLIYP